MSQFKVITLTFSIVTVLTLVCFLGDSTNHSEKPLSSAPSSHERLRPWDADFLPDLTASSLPAGDKPGKLPKGTISALTQAKVGEQISLPISFDTDVLPWKGTVLSWDPFLHPDTGFSTVVELSEPEGLLSLVEVNGSRSGHVVFTGKSAALRISSGEDDNTLIQRATVSQIFCAPEAAIYPLSYPSNKPIMVANEEKEPPHRGGKKDDAATTIPIFNSKEGHSKTIYLDFDGETVSGTQWQGTTIVAEPTRLSEREILDVCEAVSDDFVPFAVNVTTDRAVFDNTRIEERVHCIITPTRTASPGNAGVAILNSYGTGKVCWSFENSAHETAFTASHEIGHVMGLSHDGTSTQEYYRGTGGSGINAWVPIMGTSSPFGEYMVQWSKGEYPGANQTQDDIAIIGSNFWFPQELNQSPTFGAVTMEFNEDGDAIEYDTIGSQYDQDYFLIEVPDGVSAIDISAFPSSANPNLSMAVHAYRKGEPWFQTFRNHHDSLGASFTMATTPGTYVIELSASSRPTWPLYGVMGKYRVKVSHSRPLAEALELPTGTTLDFPERGRWERDWEESYQGGASARSAQIGALQRTSLAMNASGAGTLRFAWKVDSLKDDDPLRFLHNGEEMTRIKGNDWEVVELTFEEGEHTFEWCYLKNSSLNGGSDAGWIDAISFIQPSAYDLWAENHGEQLGDKNADPDGDGLNNYEEFFYDRSPFLAESTPIHSLIQQEGQWEFSFSRRPSGPGQSGIHYRILSSENLQEWRPLASGHGDSPPAVEPNAWIRTENEGTSITAGTQELHDAHCFRVEVSEEP